MASRHFPYPNRHHVLHQIMGSSLLAEVAKLEAHKVTQCLLGSSTRLTVSAELMHTLIQIFLIQKGSVQLRVFPTLRLWSRQFELLTLGRAV